MIEISAKILIHLEYRLTRLFLSFQHFAANKLMTSEMRSAVTKMISKTQQT